MGKVTALSKPVQPGIGKQARGSLRLAWKTHATLAAPADNQRMADRTAWRSLLRFSKGELVKKAQVALSWMFRKPFISAPIIGASKRHHLDDAVAALGLKLSAEEITALEEPYVPHAVAGFHKDEVRDRLDTSTKSIAKTASTVSSMADNRLSARLEMRICAVVRSY